MVQILTFELANVYVFRNPGFPVHHGMVHHGTSGKKGMKTLSRRLFCSDMRTVYPLHSRFRVLSRETHFGSGPGSGGLQVANAFLRLGK